MAYSLKAELTHERRRLRKRSFAFYGTGYAQILFQISPHNPNQIVGSLFRRPAIPRHVVANVVFHEFGHEAVDRSPCGREPLKNICALFIIVECSQTGLQLPDDLLCAIDKI
ncbi:MAG TPA: hypothetical protein VK685_00325 [Candidatus Acidoferrum sp.]|nr:hypothetical protein [Candidatus Acidoferrum sp.]